MKNLLLDTHVLLWALGSPDDLSADTREAIADPANEVFVSAATAWEMSIKAAIGKLRVPSDLDERMRELRFRPLPITFAHATAVRDLPLRHRDPFDRMLVVQAKAHGFTLVTADKAIMQYDVPTMAA